MDSAEAKLVIDRVFQGTGISRVISIDDDYELPLDVGDLVAKSLELDEKGELKTLLDGCHPELYAADSDMLSRKLRRFWDEHTTAEAKQLYALIGAADPVVQGAESPVEREAVKQLPVLFEKFQFRALSLPEWIAQSDRVLDEAHTNRTFIMFDEDMSNHGGSPIEGIIQIKETLSKTTDGSVVCCLLSYKHHAATLLESWKRVCVEHELPMSRVVVIAKDSLKEQPEQFASQLKLSAVSPHYDGLRARALEIFKECMDVSSRRISDLHIADLDNIVYVSSKREGVWEPDTLFRLMAIYHRSEMRDKAITDKEIQARASTIRSISGIDTGPSLWKASSAVWNVQHLENYEPSPQLNGLHRPTDLGDIYEKTGGKRYILIAPQCDLMVRTSSGCRGADSDLAKEGVLAQIVDEEPRPGLGWKLEFYAEGREAWVDFKRTFATWLSHLDFCVFNPEGKAELAVGSTPSELLIPAWAKRHAIAVKYIEDLLRTYVRINPCGAQKGDVNRLLTRSNNECIFFGNIDTGARSVTLNFKRVSRLLPPRSTALVKAYAEFLNRDAFEHTFTKEC